MDAKEKTRLLELHSKRIRAVRILMFVPAAIFLFLAGYEFVKLQFTDYGTVWDKVGFYGCGLIGLFYLAVGLVSIKVPKWCYTITGIAHIYFFYTVLNHAIHEYNITNETDTVVLYFVIEGLLLLLIFFLTVGAISAWKLEQLRVATDSDTNDL